MKRDLKQMELGFSLSRAEAEQSTGTPTSNRYGADSWQTAASQAATVRCAGARLSAP